MKSKPNAVTGPFWNVSVRTCGPPSHSSIGNLTGDHGADERHLAELLLTNPVLAAGDVAADVRQRLALAPGHSALSMAALSSLAGGR